MEYQIKYIEGDATIPTGKGNKILVHICNDIGAWGKGFVLALSKKWPAPEKEYRNWHKNQNGFALGNVQFVSVDDDIIIANIIGQRDIVSQHGSTTPPIRYKAVEDGLKKVAQKAQEINASVHMPKIGCGLAGGKWSEIEKIIISTLIEEKLSVTVYDFN